MKRYVLLLLIVFCLATSAPVRAVERVYQIQVTPASDGVHYVYGYEGYSQAPKIEVRSGNLGLVSIQGESGRYHGTIAFRLNWCNSRLIVDSRTVVEQRCLWFPVSAKGK